MKVFKLLAQLVTSTEFTDACYSFLEKNKHIFDDDDENKLEYTEVFEAYITILEQCIDAKLYTKFQEEQVNAFYKDFKDNWKLYETEDSEVVETLFGFIDFNKFKKQMLEFKSGAINWDKSKLEAESAIVHGLKTPQFFWDRLSEDITDKSLGWN